MCLKLTDSAWSVKVEPAPDSRGSVLVASWEGERLRCRDLVMLSVWSSQEEMMSLPVSGASGGVRLPVLPTCHLLRVRLASLVTGNKVTSITWSISVSQRRRLDSIFMLWSSLDSRLWILLKAWSLSISLCCPR